MTTYTDNETKQQLKREAEDRDMTLSKYLMQLIDRGRMAQAEETLTSRTDVEASIERVVHQSIENYHEDLLDALEKSSVYTIANFELLANDTGFDVAGGRRQDAFSTGRRRTHTPLSDHEEMLEADSPTDDVQDEPENGDRDGTGYRQTSEDQDDDGGFSLSDLRNG